jgi:hypothetical protein
MTAYRVATLSGVPRTKANAEMRRLERAGFVRSSTLESGRPGWELIDPDIRALLRKRLRIVWSEDLIADGPRLVAKVREIRSRREEIDVRLLEGPVRNPGDFMRSRQKDRILRRLGLRTSVRERR